MEKEDSGYRPRLTRDIKEKYDRIAHMARSSTYFVEDLKARPKQVLEAHGIHEIEDFVLNYLETSSSAEIFWKAHYWNAVDPSPSIN